MTGRRKGSFRKDLPNQPSDLLLSKLIIELRPTTPRKVAAAGRTSGLVLAALRYLGENHITSDRIAHLRKTLSAGERRQLLTDLPSAPAWLHPHLRAIAAKESP